MIRGLKVFDTSPGANPMHADFSIENLRDPLWIRAVRKPSAYLVKQSDLPVIRSGCSTVIDRKIKDSRKGLSQYLVGLKKKGIPLIDGNYEDTRQIFRSIRDLLSRARESGEKNLYIVGIKDIFFEEIQGTARTASSSHAPSARRDFLDQGPFLPGDPGAGPSDLVHFVKQCTVPQSLDENFIGESIEVRLVKEMILCAALVDHPVLILGGSGTGKDLVAQEIHRLSGRKGIAPVLVSCGAMQGALLHSDLFGHAKGAFAGATGKKAGKWEYANDGTLFLDEIGDLQAEHQAMILHTLQDGMVTPAGASKTVGVNARILSATNRDLFSLVKLGQFREDLFDKLSGLIIRTPSLRDIPEDIPLIARKIWKEVTRDEKADLPETIQGELAQYAWPGNVRELKVVLGGLHALFGKAGLKAQHIRLVFSLQGHSVSRADGYSMEKGMPRLSRTLNRLKSITETLHALEAGLLSIRGEDWQDAASIMDSLRFHMNDLEFLCREPSLFGEKETFLAVHHLRGQLSYYFDSLKKAESEVLVSAKDVIGREIGKIITRVARTVEDLLEGNNSRPIAQKRGITE
jgi:transcriptional regulator with AAA-type ATPase domain